MSSNEDRLAFVTLVTDASDVIAARRLILSLRTFSGEYYRQPFLVYVSMDEKPELERDDKTKVIQVIPPESLRLFPLGCKVHICSAAEREFAGKYKTMVFLDAHSLILRPPYMLELDCDSDASFRPVHLKNVGQPADEPLSDYWRFTYALVGNVIPGYRVNSIVDNQFLYPYYNTHCFSIKPELKLCQTWAELFSTAIDDSTFQQAVCPDFPHRLFFHQVLFSCLVADRLGEDRIRMLPTDYSYPYHLQQDLPPNAQSRCMNELTHLVYEDSPMHPDNLKDIKVKEPLKTFLSDLFRGNDQ